MRASAPRAVRPLVACAIVALVLGATLAAYFPALRGGLVWDDDFHVTKAALRSLSGLARIWFRLGATSQYYPVLHTAFWIEYHLWGDATLGYHLVNMFLHAASACLFILLLQRLKVPGAWFGGLLFALHPVGVESVAWISEQKNTLSTVFYLLATLTYLRWRVAARPYLYFLATAFFILAILSKSVTVTLPAALLVIIWWQDGRLAWRRDVRPLIPWFVLGAAAGLLTAWVERRYIGAQGTAFALTPVDRLLLAGRVSWFYFGKLLWPANLIFIYPHWTIDATELRQCLYPLAALGALAGLWALRGRTRAPLAIALLFVGSLFPALGFFNVYPFQFSYVADHFQYLASLAIYAAAAGAWGAWERRGQVAKVGTGGPPVSTEIQSNRTPTNPTPYLAAVVVLGVLGVLTWRQSHNYRDARTLYEATLASNPACWLADTNLGILLADAGQPAAAVVRFNQSLAINPDSSETHLDMGNALRALGQNAGAMAQYGLALQGRPNFAPAHYNKGVALAGVGQRDEAIAEYREAIRLNPDYAEAHDNLGNALRDSRRLPEALAEYRIALQLDPASAEFHNNLGVALAEGGQLPEAIDEMTEAIRLRPRYADAEDNLGMALAQTGHADDALRHFQAAVDDAPDRLESHYNFAIFLARAGRMPDAIVQLQESVHLRPDFPEGHDNLGNALRAVGRTDDAIAEYRQAIRLRPGYREAHRNLGLALQSAGRTEEAQAEFEAAGATSPAR
jgi:protein O-mannosyl-transferase